MLQPIDRRTFLADLGRGACASAIVSIAACTPSAQATPGRSGPIGSSTAPDGVASPSVGSDSSPPRMPPARDGTSWRRVNLGFVSAYVLVRGGQAAIVDTGVAGSAGAIEAALTEVGLDWASVGDVILTHRHGDHAGSAADVLELAPDATGYAGADDIGAVSVPRPLSAVGDGDSVFGLQIIATPGHTPGSISVLDATSGILVAGDALRTEGGRPALPGADFTEDMDEAIRSIAKLGGLAFDTLLVGHGEPIEGSAGAAVAELAASQ